MHLNPRASQSTFLFSNSNVVLYSLNPFFQSLCTRQTFGGGLGQSGRAGEAKEAWGHAAHTGEFLFNPEICLSCVVAFVRHFSAEQGLGQAQHCALHPFLGQGGCRHHRRSEAKGQPEALAPSDGSNRSSPAPCRGAGIFSG